MLARTITSKINAHHLCVGVLIYVVTEYGTKRAKTNGNADWAIFSRHSPLFSQSWRVYLKFIVLDLEMATTRGSVFPNVGSIKNRSRCVKTEGHWLYVAAAGRNKCGDWYENIAHPNGCRFIFCKQRSSSFCGRSPNCVEKRIL